MGNDQSTNCMLRSTEAVSHMVLATQVSESGEYIGNGVGGMKNKYSPYSWPAQESRDNTLVVKCTFNENLNFWLHCPNWREGSQGMQCIFKGSHNTAL